MSENTIHCIYFISGIITLILTAIVCIKHESILTKSALRDGRYITLKAFLRTIGARLERYRSSGLDRIVFVLNEMNDTEEPYYSFVKKILNAGVKITYSSEKEHIGENVERLIDKLNRDQGLQLENQNEFNNLIDFKRLKRSPRGDNMCFLVTSDQRAITAFSGHRSNGKTVGGSQLIGNEASDEWKDLQSIFCDTTVSNDCG